MCHSPAASPKPFFVVSRPSLALGPRGPPAIKLPSAAAATRGPFHCLSELIPHPAPLLTDVCPFVTRADRVSLLTPLRFSAATGTEVPLFSAQTCWKRDRGLFPKPWPLCTPTHPRPLKTVIFLFQLFGRARMCSFSLKVG